MNRLVHLLLWIIILLNQAFSSNTLQWVSVWHQKKVRVLKPWLCETSYENGKKKEKERAKPERSDTRSAERISRRGTQKRTGPNGHQRLSPGRQWYEKRILVWRVELKLKTKRPLPLLRSFLMRMYLRQKSTPSTLASSPWCTKLTIEGDAGCCLPWSGFMVGLTKACCGAGMRVKLNDIAIFGLLEVNSDWTNGHWTQYE